MTIKLKKIFCLSLLLSAFFFCNDVFAGMATFNDRRDVQQFIDQMVKQHHFNGPWLNRLFSQVQIRPELLRKIRRPTEAMPWFRYQELTVTPRAVTNGLAFWSQHANTLAAAEKRYGVPSHMIVALIGIETNYGRITGNYGVFNTLATLAFSSSPRAGYFRKELVEYLLFARENRFNPLAIKGSYAGAMGFPQFMPSSYRTFAVSVNGQAPDLFHNPNDAIFSVANYFKNHGWQPGKPVVIAGAITPQHTLQRYLNNTLRTRFTVKQLMQAGLHPKSPISPDTKANLLVLRNYDKDDYWLALNNFYVITAYNHSPNYAMAVYQLAQKLQHARIDTHRNSLSPARQIRRS